ncbi:MAG: hypothetical protein ABIL06_21480 [Pseudomonadota bacterium]
MKQSYHKFTGIVRDLLNVAASDLLFQNMVTKTKRPGITIEPACSCKKPLVSRKGAKDAKAE